MEVVSGPEFLVGAGGAQFAMADGTVRFLSSRADPEVLTAVRRRSLATLRAAIEPVAPAVLGRLITTWQGVTRRRRGLDAVPLAPAPVLVELRAVDDLEDVEKAECRHGRLLQWKSGIAFSTVW